MDEEPISPGLWRITARTLDVHRSRAQCGRLLPEATRAALKLKKPPSGPEGPPPQPRPPGPTGPDKNPPFPPSPPLAGLYCLRCGQEHPDTAQARATHACH